MTKEIHGLLLALVVLCGCAQRGAQLDLTRPLEGRIFDPAAARFLSRDEAMERARRASFVLLGERHDNPEHHRLQAHVIEQLANAGKRPAIVLEMVVRDHDPKLQAFARSGSRDVDALAQSLAWAESGWPSWAIYRPIALAAVQHGLRLVAGDLDRHTRAQLRHGGLASLSERQLDRLRLSRAVDSEVFGLLAESIERAHCGHAPSEHIPRMVETQHARDAQLAASLRQAAKEADGSAVLIAGAGHVARGLAVPRFLDEKAGESSLVLSFVEVSPDTLDPRRYVEPGEYDLVWFTSRVDTLDPCEEFREQLEKKLGTKTEARLRAERPPPASAPSSTRPGA